MIKMMNLSSYVYDMDRFDNNYKKVNKFLDENKIEAIELFGIKHYNENLIDKNKIKGVHLSHYPTWLDFYNGNKEALCDDFASIKDAIKTYGGETKQAIINMYKEEIKLAQKLKVEYVVFHVSNVKMKHCYTYDFTYTDKEVIDSTIDIVNEVFKDLNADITILFENLHWPGLRLNDKELVKYFMESIKYENKGIMLDTSHLICTNLEIKTEEDAIDYIIEVVNNLGNLKKYIKGIHLSKSLSGEYVKTKIKEYESVDLKYIDKINEIITHIMNIDEHKPFTNKKIKKLIDIIHPKYLIYELISDSLEEHSQFIKVQENALN